MAKATIELAKPYNPSKMTYPATVTVKLDGVPARLSRSRLPQSRQGNDITSIAHIQNFFMTYFANSPNTELVGEIYVHGMSFKDISGKVRKTDEQFTEAKLYVYDLISTTLEGRDAPHGLRMQALDIMLDDIAGQLGKARQDLPIIAISGITVDDACAARAAHEAFMQALPDAEGTMLASLKRPFCAGKRTWALQKCKPEPTIDLEIIGFQEAVEASSGTGKGRVGRLVAKLWRLDADGTSQPRQIGIGPGKLTHEEAKQLWEDYKSRKWTNRIAEIKYMRDDSYDSLRQPTFQRWRDDKDEPDTTAEL